MLTLNLVARTMRQFYLLYCSQTLACSDSLPCGEEMATRFRWNF